LTHADRYVVLGLARRRAPWIRNVAQWANSAAIPAEFSMCLSPAELFARLAGGRVYSAVLLDAGLGLIDRDLIERVRAAGCTVFVVDDGDRGRDWPALGVHDVLPASFTRAALLDALATHSSLIDQMAFADRGAHQDVQQLTPEGVLVSVCGAGGTGASTVAAALAQGLATDDRHGRIVLADLALHAEQAMLHDVGDVAPGVQELVDAHRSRQPDGAEIEGLLFEVASRRYRLLLGLRHARQWSLVRPSAFTSGLRSLRGCFDVTVCDVTADFESERDAGSADVEERNVMARTAVLASDVVFVVGLPGVKGVHSMVRIVGELVHQGVDVGRIALVVNQATRHPRSRAELSTAVAALLEPIAPGGLPASPTFLPVRKVDAAWRDRTPLPAPLPRLLSGAFDATLRRAGRSLASAEEPALVRPGSLGVRGDD
jgi:septum formation inhibitor-activating ATPase MinD